MSGDVLSLWRHISATGGQKMQFLTLREFSKSPKAALAKLAQDGKAVLTNNGKPAAIMLNVDADSFERVFLLVKEVEQASAKPAAADDERQKAFEHLMNFPRRLTPDLDYKKELMEALDEKYGPVD
jgi:hypothetical protein